jgi:hypothetical protein
MATTTNLGLTKLASSDLAANCPTVENANLEKLDAAYGGLATTEYFSVTLSESITDALVRTPNASWYNPATGIVCLNVIIVSNSGAIPTANGTIFTVPAKYRPSTSVDLGYALLKPLNEEGWGPLWSESVRIDANGTVKLGNFIYGSTQTKLFMLFAIYKK